MALNMHQLSIRGMLNTGRGSIVSSRCSLGGRLFQAGLTVFSHEYVVFPVPVAYDMMVMSPYSQGVKVEESTVFSRDYYKEVIDLSTLSVFEAEIWCFRGGNDIPKWILHGHRMHKPARNQDRDG